MEAHGAVRLFVQQYSQLQGHGPANEEEWLSCGAHLPAGGGPSAGHRASCGCGLGQIDPADGDRAGDRPGGPENRRRTSHLRAIVPAQPPPGIRRAYFQPRAQHVFGRQSVYNGSLDYLKVRSRSIILKGPSSATATFHRLALVRPSRCLLAAFDLRGFWQPRRSKLQLDEPYNVLTVA